MEAATWRSRVKYIHYIICKYPKLRTAAFLIFQNALGGKVRTGYLSIRRGGGGGGDWWAETFRKRSPEWNDLRTGTIWKRCFPVVDGENDTIWKRWRHHNNTTRLQTTQPWVSKIKNKHFLVASSVLIADIFSILTLLKARLNRVETFWFFKKRTRYYKAS